MFAAVFSAALNLILFYTKTKKLKMRGLIEDVRLIEDGPGRVACV